MNIFYTAEFQWFSNEISNYLPILSRRGQTEKKVTFSSEKSKYWFLSANHRPIQRFDLAVQAVSLLGPVNANLHTFYNFTGTFLYRPRT